MLNMSEKETNLTQEDTFIHNTELKWFDLNGNSITDIHSQTFRNNSRPNHLDMSENEINSIDPNTFIHNTELECLDL